MKPAKREREMGRYHIHCNLTSEAADVCSAQMTVSVDADSDDEAQSLVFALFADTEFDVVEIDWDGK